MRLPLVLLCTLVIGESLILVLGLPSIKPIEQQLRPIPPPNATVGTQHYPVKGCAEDVHIVLGRNEDIYFYDVGCRNVARYGIDVDFQGFKGNFDVARGAAQCSTGECPYTGVYFESGFRYARNWTVSPLYRDSYPVLYFHCKANQFGGCKVQLFSICFTTS